MPEITKQVFDKGQVNVFLVNYRTDISKQHKNNLPYVMSKEQWQDGNRFLYTEVVDFTYGPGWLEINFRASDFAYEENLDINPPAMDFDVVITYPQD